MGSAAWRSARPPRSYLVRHQRLESWTPPQERRSCVKGLTPPKAVEAKKLESGCCRFRTAPTALDTYYIESLWFEAAIGDLQAVAWGPARPPTYNLG